MPEGMRDEAASPGAIADQTERRRCRTCGEELPLDRFWRNHGGRPAPDCKACAAARQRAYAKTAQGRQVVRDAQRRYRARRRGARPNEPGLRRLVADEVRLAARSAGTAELAVAPHLWQMLGSPPWVDLERVTPNRVDVTAGEDYPAADGPGAPRIALTAAACRALRLAPGRYPASHEPGRLVIALPAGTWPEPPPKPVPDDPPELLIQPPYYLAMTRAAYEALGSPAHLQPGRGQQRARGQRGVDDRGHGGRGARGAADGGGARVGGAAGGLLGHGVPGRGLGGAGSVGRGGKVRGAGLRGVRAGGAARPAAVGDRPRCAARSWAGAAGGAGAVSAGHGGPCCCAMYARISCVYVEAWRCVIGVAGVINALGVRPCSVAATAHPVRNATASRARAAEG